MVPGFGLAAVAEAGEVGRGALRERKREVRGREEGGGRPGAEGVTCQAEEDRGLLEAGRTILDEDVKEGAQIR